MSSVNDPIADALRRQGDAIAQARQGGTRLSFPEFFAKYPPAPDYVFGRHTCELSEELDEAARLVEAGGRYYATVSIPPRHGKSDQASRRFPAWYLLRNPNHEVMLAAYNGELAEEFSIESRRIFTEVAPEYGLGLSDDLATKGAWKIKGHKGGMYAVGLNGSITGRGAHVLIVDDPCPNREAAESELWRNKAWDVITSDLLTRLAPAHLVIFVATRWHEDDPIGRIEERMRKDPKFKRFKQILYPAQYEDGSYLFPERYSAEWYESQRALVGEYAWQSLYQGDPRPRTGRMLRADLCKIVEPDEVPKSLKLVRGWDLASTERERIKDDPDYTVGVLSGFDGERLWIVDVQRGQWSAPTRDARIVETAKRDGRGVLVRIECVAGYKDTYERIRSVLRGHAVVRPVLPKGDKVAENSVLEPLFEAGRVMLVRGAWNSDYIAEAGAFPKGKKDDQVDATRISCGELIDPRRRMKISL